MTANAGARRKKLIEVALPLEVISEARVNYNRCERLAMSEESD